MYGCYFGERFGRDRIIGLLSFGCLLHADGATLLLQNEMQMIKNKGDESLRAVSNLNMCWQ